MIYEIFRDLVLLIHCAFVLFVVFGGLFAFRWKKILWWHLPSLTWGILVEWTGWFCPLTSLEDWLGEKAMEAGSQGGLIGPHLFPFLYPASISRGMQIFGGALVLCWNLLLYGFLVRWLKKERKRDIHE